jgi:hypothetical protein
MMSILGSAAEARPKYIILLLGGQHEQEALKSYTQTIVAVIMTGTILVLYFR